MYEHEVEFNAVDVPPTGPSVGDWFALRSDLFTNASQTAKVDHAGVVCTQDSVTLGALGEDICTFTISLAAGQITTAGLVDVASSFTPGGTFVLPIVGGSGRYQGARGEVSVRIVNQTDSVDRFSLR